jgi:hypothetical protein
VTKSPAGPRCRWCGRPFDANERGRPRRYCRPSCKQRDYEARQRAAEVGLSEGELVVARAALDELHDALYILESAVADVERDLAADDGLEAHREAVAWLLEAARPLIDRSGGPALNLT